MTEKPPPSEEDKEKEAEQAFTEDVVARGEAVPEGEELPPGATHEVVEDEEGRRKLRRRRFSAF